MTASFGFIDPADFWLQHLADTSNNPSGLVKHLQDRSRDLAMREIAALAAIRNLSQGSLAKSYSQATRKKITAANVNNHFHTKKSHASTLETYARIVRMPRGYLRLVSEPWPIFAWPSAGSKYTIGAYLAEHLQIDHMGPLLTSTEPLEQTKECLSQDKTRAEKVAHRVALERERRLALKESSGLMRNAIAEPHGVSYQVLASFDALRNEMTGHVDFKSFFVERTSREEQVQRVLLDLFRTLWPLSDVGPASWDENWRQGVAEKIPPAHLTPHDVAAMLHMATGLLRGRGFDVKAILERLTSDPMHQLYSSEWVAKHSPLE